MSEGRRLRTRSRKNYTDHDDELLAEVLGKEQKWSIEEKVLLSENYQGKFVEELTADQFNVSYIQRTGFPHPVLIKQQRGLGLRVPTAQFSIHDVRACIGSQRIIDVMNVETQESQQMTMKSWTDYYDQPADKRAKLLNVISLEFSHTALEKYVESPSIVREIDWVSNAWPNYWLDIQAQYQNNLKQEHMYYPKTRKYCLMSVAKCFTDFHIDMGGSSVWYHVLKGKKVFWLLPPTESHLRLYEEWILAGRQNECFFADLCTSNDCQMIILEPGWTFFLPSGWIHAVYTPEDSLVFGGNFLNSFKIPMQIKVWTIERKVRVPDRFRYPYFIQSMWYIIERYVHSLTGWTHIADDCLECADDESIDRSDLKPCQTNRLAIVKNDNNHHHHHQQDLEQAHQHLTQFERDGLQTLCSFLRKLKDKSIPEDLIQTNELLQTMERLLIEHASDNPQLAITGQSIIHYNYPSSYSTERDSFQGIKRKISSSTDDMQQTSFHHLHPSHQYETLVMPPPSTSNVVTLHPSTTVLLSGPLASSNSSNYYPPPTSHPPPPPPPSQYYPPINPQQYSPDKNLPAKDRHKRVRCKQCEPCCRDDCSECVHCKDMPKFGGVGKMKQCCLTKQCIAPILPSTASCQVCSKKKGSRKLSQLKPDEILYECERCMEIHHLPCFHTSHADISTGEGVFSDDIPETWLCPKCITANIPEPPLYKLRPIVRRTLVTTNKGKNGLIELPFPEPIQHHSIPHPHHQTQHYPIYGQNNVHYSDSYDMMENEAKKRRMYSNMYPTPLHHDSSMLPPDPSTLINHHHHVDDLDSDLYIPTMFAV